jgi:hypothetical protein
MVMIRCGENCWHYDPSQCWSPDDSDVDMRTAKRPRNSRFVAIGVTASG